MIHTGAQLTGRGEWFQVAQRLVSRCVPSWLMVLDQRYLLVCRRMPSVPSEIPNDYVLAKASFLNSVDIAECLGDPNATEMDRRLRRFAASGSTFYVARRAGKVCAFCRIAPDEYTVMFDGYQKFNVTVPLDPNTCVIGYIYVHPEARRRGLGAALLGHAISQRHSSIGRMPVLSVVRPDNGGSMRMHRRVGFSVVGSYYYVASPLARVLIVRSMFSTARVYRLTGHTVVNPCKLS